MCKCGVGETTFVGVDTEQPVHKENILTPGPTCQARLAH